jgi:hypothetical protein
VSISYENQLKLTDHLLHVLEVELSGRGTEELFGRPPADQYQLGVLGPWENSSDAIYQPIVERKDVESDSSGLNQIKRETSIDGKAITEPILDRDTDTSFQELENEDSERSIIEDILRKRGVPSALGCDFIVKAEEKINIEISSDFSFYTRRFPTYKQILSRLNQDDSGNVYSAQSSIQIEERYIRHNVSVQDIHVKLENKNQQTASNIFQDYIDDILKSETEELDVWRELSRQTLPAKEILTEKDYINYLEGLVSNIALPPIEVELDVRTKKISKNELRVGIYLINKTSPAEKFIDNATRFIIDAKLSIKIHGTLLPIEIHTSPESYQYDPFVMAVGQNCAVSVTEINDFTILQTKALASFEQLRLISKNELEIEFVELASNPIPLLSEIHSKMKDYSKLWEDKIDRGEIHFRNEIEEIYCKSDLENFKQEAYQFQSGINTLLSDENLLKAFKAMHRVFHRVGAKKGIRKWRLFQLGFIVTQLESLAIREGRIESDTLEYADVLWFPTGGGKTEAYLGLISCALLYDRLRGKNFGVSVWLRFPLRMLSVQQLQRAINVIHETEKERGIILGEDSKWSDPISLGYFVGKSSTPNQLTDQDWAGKWKFSELVNNRDLRNELRMVRNCPECQTPNSIEIEIDPKIFRIFHVCKSCGEVLNIFVSDDEIYRYLPSVLIGTVDKLPSVAWRKHFSHIWSGPEKKCPSHGYLSGKYCIVFGCDDQKEEISNYDPAPSLQIQDELHLLREELGTFAGHYETLATTCQTRNARIPPKILAATATVEGLTRQAKHLYGLKARRFPTRGFELGESFYTTIDKENGYNKIARRYVGFRPAFLGSPEASSLVLEILYKEIRELYNLLLTEGLPEFKARTKIDGIEDITDALEMLDKYDTTLTYVGSKAHGSRIERNLSVDISKRVSKAGDRQLEVVYLNGESSLDDIAETIQSLEAMKKWDESDRLDAVIGTSLISHGVDVTRFNLMMMSGMPGRTAEYIQSSSRSGRQYVGIIIVAFTPWMLRDASLYHRFETYHYHMEHLVEPVPINRFSKYAVDKTLPGLFSGLLNAYFSPEIGLYLDKIREYHSAIYNRSLTEEMIHTSLYSAYGVNLDIFSQGLSLAIKDQIDKRFRTEVRKLRSPGSIDRVTDAFSTRPMTSLRDVDTPVDFEPKVYSYSELRWLDR